MNKQHSILLPYYTHTHTHTHTHQRGQRVREREREYREKREEKRKLYIREAAAIHEAAASHDGDPPCPHQSRQPPSWIAAAIYKGEIPLIITLVNRGSLVDRGCREFLFVAISQLPQGVAAGKN